MRAALRQRRLFLAAGSFAFSVVALTLILMLQFCAAFNGRDRLVEVFDNGPVGGPRGASEGYIWVGKNDLPPPGKTWAPTDPERLTPQQKARIR